MKLIRIGKDISISWALYRTTEGGREPYALTQGDCSLRLVSPVGKILVEDFTIDGNVISWVFRGRDQRHTGDYSLELVQREGKDGMLTVDTCEAFKLVAYSCLEGESESLIESASSEAQRIRIGKDFTIRWRIFASEDGALVPYDCTGKDLTLCLDSPYKRSKVEGFTVEGNLIEWTFKGKDQKSTGSYRLVLIENQGKDGMLTVDTCDAFELVAHSCEESFDLEASATIDAEALSGVVETSAVELESSFTAGSVSLKGDINLAPYVQSIGGGDLDIESEQVIAGAFVDLNNRLKDERTSYATKRELAKDVARLTSEIEQREEVTAAALAELNTRIVNNMKVVERGYLTLDEFTKYVADLTSEIQENERVIAAALTDINERLLALTNS